MSRIDKHIAMCCHIQIKLDENELLEPQPRSTGYRPKLSGTRTPDSGAEIKAPMVAWLPNFEFSPKSKHLSDPTLKEKACMPCQEIVLRVHAKIFCDLMLQKLYKVHSASTFPGPRFVIPNKPPNL